MLSSDEQEQIIRANKKAFEELALSWRNPETGETEPDLRQAVGKMICEYLAVPGYACARPDILLRFPPLYHRCVGCVEDSHRSTIKRTLLDEYFALPKTEKSPNLLGHR